MTTADARGVRRGRRCSWSPSRVAAGLVLAAWAGLFWFLLATGRWSLYLSTRTLWVVPTGADPAHDRGAGQARDGARAHGPSRSPSAHAWTLGVIALPVVLVLALPPATLSGYALGRRGGFVGLGGERRRRATSRRATLSFIDVAAAQTSKAGMAALRVARRRAGHARGVRLASGRRGRRRDPADALRRHVLRGRRDERAGPRRERAAGTLRARRVGERHRTIYPLGQRDPGGRERRPAIPQPDRPYLTP